MKKGIIFPKSRIEVVQQYRECETIEEMLKRAIYNNEPIKATAKVTYNDRKDGVLPQHDIRQDRFEIARTQSDKVHASQYAKRMKQDGFVQDENGKWVKPAVDIKQPVGEA